MSTDSYSARLREARTAAMDVEELAQRRLRATGRQADLQRRLDSAGEAASDASLAGESLAQLEETVEALHVAEEELRQQNEDLESSRLSVELARQRYEELFDHAPDGYLTTSLVGIVREANRAAVLMIGAPRSFVVGKPVAILFRDELRREVRTLLARLENGDRADDVELELKPRGASPFPVAVTVAVARNAAGRATGLRWLVRDARERAASRARPTALAEQLEARVAERTRQLDAARRMQEELVRLERVARASAERAQERLRFAASAGAVLAEAEGVAAVMATAARLALPALGDWCMLYVPADERDLRGGAPMIEIAHAGAGDRLADSLRGRYTDTDAMPPVLARVLDSGRPELEADLAHWNDAASASAASHQQVLHALGVSASMAIPLTARGRRIGVTCCLAAAGRRYDEIDLGAAEELARAVAVALDNARRLEAAERAARAAERRVAAAGQGVAVMMHDVRTPLAAVGGYADLLAMGAYGPLSAEQAEAVARLHRGYEYMLELVDHVQTFTRLEGGAVDLDCEPLELDALLAELYPQLEHQVRERGISYEMRPGPNALTLVTDATAVRRVLVNLLTNAFKYTDPGGHVTLEWEANGARVDIRVRDTGRGIPAEQLAVVFEPFAQLDQSGERQGIGLGLAIARRLARALGGDVLAESVVGAGSTFTLRLPLGQPCPPAGR